MKSKNETYQAYDFLLKFFLRCPICYVDYTSLEKLKQLPCDHAFHPSCIKEWLKKKCTCPMCNAKVEV